MKRGTMSASKLSDYSYRGILLANAAPGVQPIPSRDLVGRIGGANSVTGFSAWPGLLTWGRPRFSLGNGSDVLYAGLAPRMGGRDMSPVEVEQSIEQADGISHAILPPLWAMRSSHRRTDAYTDCLGFGHLYYRELTDRVVLSTSARALGLTDTGGLCDEALAVQSLVGWQLGVRTMFAGVNKIHAGGRISVRDGRLEATRAAPTEAVITSSQPDIDCARLLRNFMNSYLDDHPDAELQLTGGLDSRILLAAIPPARRKNVAVMTLAVPSATEDVGLASRIAQQYGMQHKILDMSGLAELSPAEALELTLTAARRLDSAADPIALAAVDFAELSADPGPRIAGLGGEVLRGFYYFGHVRHTPVTKARVERLARWRIMANEAAPRQMFDDGFAAWASNFVVEDLYREFKATGAPWSIATDQFYLGQRMHRWAGVLASASAMDRTIVNPMLDAEFLSIARGVAAGAEEEC